MSAKMFGCDLDDKLHTLEPVVILERLQFSAVTPKPQKKNDNEKHALRKNTDGHNNNKTKYACNKSSNISHDDVLSITFLDHHYSKDLNKCSPIVQKSILKKWSQERSRLLTLETSCITQNKSKVPPSRCLQKSVERRYIKDSDHRPYMCSQCQESFHTSSLLAVHKRIHYDDDSGENDSEVDVCSYDDDIFNSIKKNSRTQCTVPSTSISTNNVLKKNGVLLPEILSNNEEESIDSNRAQPVSKLESGKKKVRALIVCKECPASFSQQWYLNLHLILLHYINDKNCPINCPSCQRPFKGEEDLRQHIQDDHSSDLRIMNNEISSSLGLLVDSLTGESLKASKRKVQSAPREVRVAPSDILTRRKNCPWNWHEALPSQKDLIIDLVEAELKFIVAERNVLGDHFAYSDLQRLSLQICDTLKISNFFYGKPPKRWAQRLLTKVHQIPRPGRFRFVHNVNLSYVNAIAGLSHRGLTENNVFYAFEAKLWEVKGNEVYSLPSVKTQNGALSPDGLSDDTLSAIISFNSLGTVVVYPFVVFRGREIDPSNLQNLRGVTHTSLSKGLIGNCEWLAKFIATISPVRPVLLLVEGDVTHLTYSIIHMTRQNDVHIVFLPSRDRFVHSHQIIRESVLFPFIETFDRESSKLLAAHRRKSLPLTLFGHVFESSWKITSKEVQIQSSFVQAGFLPLPKSTHSLEKATKEYLKHVKDRDPTPSDSNCEPSSTGPSPSTTVNDSEVPSPVLLPEDIKEEPMEFDDVTASSHPVYIFEQVKLEVEENNVLEMDIKEEPIELQPIDSRLSETISNPSLDEMKQEAEEKLPYRCHNCNQSFTSNQTLSEHQCFDTFEDQHGSSPSQKPYRCGDCGLSYSTEHDLRSHGCTVSDEDNYFTCPVCDSQFFEEATLFNHKCHANKEIVKQCNLFSCHLCGMSFALKDTLDFHLTMHDSNLRITHVTQKPNVSRNPNVAFDTINPQPDKLSCPADLVTQNNKRPLEEDGDRPANHNQQKLKKKTHTAVLKPAPSNSAKKLSVYYPPNQTMVTDQGYNEMDSTSQIKIVTQRFNENFYWKRLPAPPLPEHDYLGQLYQRTTLVSTLQN